jgi:hypothetical protein
MFQGVVRLWVIATMATHAHTMVAILSHYNVFIHPFQGVVWIVAIALRMVIRA